MDQVILAKCWRRQGGILALALLLLIALYYTTYSSIVTAWIRSETFTHGFIIIPICCWLIWRIRGQIAQTKPQINYLGIPLLLILGIVWLMANYIGILAIEQLVATLMIPVVVFTLLGWQTCSVMAFPLFFIMFAVPIGEELTPALINFTADFTVVLVEMTGIPIYREGTFFQLPTGDWSVVAACSGVRYLIASVTLGVLYAYLSYNSFKKRLIFITASFIVPIIANGLRAFLIVMIGHFSGMELATGVDHLIYGWLFFGIVIMAMFYIGSYWSDDEKDIKKSSLGWQVGQLADNTLAYKLSLIAIALIITIWPLKLQFEQQETDFSQVAEISLTAPMSWQELPSELDSWKPAYSGFDREYSARYENQLGDTVTLFIGYYAQQRQGAELDNYNNVLVSEKDVRWRAIPDSKLLISEADILAPSAVIKSHSSQYLTSYFYYVDGNWATNKYQTKLLQAKKRILGEQSRGALVVVTTQFNEEEQARQLLQNFSSEMIGEIQSVLDDMK